MRYTLFRIVTLSIVLILITLSQSFAQEVLFQPRVRLIYFLPKDRPALPERKVALQKLILDTQKDFADLMEGHGFGRKTFTLETNRQGKPMVHYVNGKFSDAHYIKGHPRGAFGKVWDEIHEQFDISKDFYLVAIDVSLPKIGGVGGMISGHSGYALMPAWGDHFSVGLAVHELYHVFGLHHALGFHDHPFTLCAAEWFNVHPAFNRSQNTMNRPSTTEILPPTLAASPNVIHLRFRVADPDGIHHVHLNLINDPSKDRDPWLIDCTALDGKTSSTVEFVTDYLSPKTDYVQLHVMDVHGNIERSQSYPINITTVLPRAKVVSIPDAGLAEAIRREIGNSITTHTILNLDVVFADARKEVTDLTGLEHAHNLQELILPGNRVSDFSVLAGLTKLELFSGPLSDVSALPRLPNLIQLTIYASSVSASDIAAIATLSRFPKLNGLGLGYNNISDVSALSELTKLNRLYLSNNNISDVSTLSELIKLNTLNLSNNNISDVSALSELTNLDWLWLRGNQISDVSPLSGLTKLEWLDVRENPLSYASVHTHIPAMQARGVRVKFNKRTNPALIKISGDGQVAEVGTPLASPFVVEAVNRQGKPMKGVRVNFTVTSGGGACRPATATTNAKGQVRATLRLGSTPGMHTVTVTAKGIRSLVTFTAHATGPPIYWIDAKTGTLHRSVKGIVETLVPRVQNATSLAVDVASGNFYWTEQTSNKTGKIQRANLDGSNVHLVKNLTSVPRDVVIDPINSKLYLANSWGKIQRMNLDGSNFRANLITGLGSPKGLALDVVEGKLYWIEQTGEAVGKIQRANLDGSKVERVKSLTSVPRDLAIDTANRKLYLTNSWGKIQRLNVDGSKFEPNLITGLDSPEGIAVDMIAGKLYWTEIGGIRCANLNGENIQSVITSLGATNIALGTLLDSVAAAPMINTPAARPDTTALLPNYPNPFNPETWIPYQLAEPADVTLNIYAVNGPLVRTLLLGYQPAGYYTNKNRAAYWDGCNNLGEPVANGIYFYQLQTNEVSPLQKMVILK